MLPEKEHNMIIDASLVASAASGNTDGAALSVATIIVDAQGTILFADGPLLARLPQASEIRIGMPIIELFPTCTVVENLGRLNSDDRQTVEQYIEVPQSGRWFIRASSWSDTTSQRIVLSLKLVAANDDIHRRIDQLEQQIQAIVEHSTDGIAIVRNEKTVLVNPRLLSMSGYPRREFLSLHFLDMVHPDDRSMVHLHYQNRLDGRTTPSVYRFRFLRHDGSLQWVEVRASLINWNGDTATLNFLSDITEVIRKEEAIREQEISIQNQYQGIPLPAFTLRRLNADYCIVNFNQEAMTLTRGMVADCIGKPITSLKGIGEVTLQALDECFIRKQRIYRETGLRLDDGKSLDLAYWFSFIPPDMIMLVVDDISARKRMERALIESEQRYRMIVEHAPAGIVIVSTAGRILEANRGTLLVSGYSIDELRAMDIHALCRNPRQFDAIMGRLTLGENVQDHPLDLIGKRGRLIHTNVTVTRFPSATADTFLFVLTDVTQYREAELNLLKVKIFENLVATLSTEFISLNYDKIDTGINNALFLVGKFLKADRVFIVQLDEECTHISSFHEWHSPGTLPTMSDQVNVKPQQFNTILRRLRNGDPCFIRHVDEIDEQDVDYRRIFASHSIKLAIYLPLLSHDRLIGTLGLTYYRSAESWINEKMSALEITARIFVNIIERKVTEEALNRFRYIVNTSRDHMLFLDTEGRIITVNDAFCDYLGASRQELAGRYMSDLFAGNDLARSIASGMKPCLAGSDVHADTVADFPGRPNRYLELGMFPFRERQQVTGVIVNLHDCTDRVGTEKELLNVSENERLQIAMELHDTISHDLLGISVKCRLLAQELSSHQDSTEARILSIESMILKSMNMLRQMSRGLFPYREGLVNLQGMLLDIAAQAIDIYHIECTADTDSGIELNDHTTLRHIYYIIREAVLNAIKHASSTRVDIRAFREDDAIVISVVNNGQTLPESPDYSKGLGLRLLKYRARIINGSIDISRIIGTGTELRLSIKRG